MPGEHYIQLRDDFKDLPEKIGWCDDHPDECLEIIKNANQFMFQFRNAPREEEIEKLVIEEHLKRVDYYE